MNETLTAWYLVANPSAEDSVIKRRWTAVQKVADTLVPKGVLELARTFYRLPSKDPDRFEELINAVREGDASFVPKERDLEITVLAGMVLFHSISLGRDKIGNLSALSSVVPNLGGLRKPVLPGLLDAAEQYLADRSAQLRERQDWQSSQKLADQETTDELLTAIKANQWPVVADKLEDVLTGYAEILAVQSKHIANLEASQNLLREESDMHWWLTGLHSRTLGKGFSEVPIGPASLIIGHELASLTRVPPGPLAIGAFINRALVGAHGKKNAASKSSIAAAINGLPQSVRSTWGAAASCGDSVDLCPLLSGVVNSTAVDEECDWPPLFKKAQTIEPTSSLAPAVLARQMYFECLLLRGGG